MKILLAPSETKKSGGEKPFDISSLLFNELLPYRNRLLHSYINILQRGDLHQLSKMFGLKKEADIKVHIKDIIHEPAMKAIERYTGVAFDHLSYDTLNANAKIYIDSHVILFSNLFGVLRANDEIPEYRLKQGEPIGEIKVEKFYKEHLSEHMDNYLADEDVLDLRAGFYDKFYIPSKPYTTLKFIKEGKVVSHWAKAYRGIVLKEVAKAGIESLEEFMKLPIEGLCVQEILHSKNKTEIIYEINA
ncbi:YaaA family protein [Sulfurovum sp. zt1-1]|uniref:YaaA family protein n=1 Tax=Sulfurovum zhangzhouensis TaxID=3019067 RepID=A0ABT7R013_9BACT|nr:YaaA family protein [Sulfurovum zhangzhouensis]MDM5272378.1 YaaA family protein [Sulfurovum zhangzhouensis]